MGDRLETGAETARAVSVIPRPRLGTPFLPVNGAVVLLHARAMGSVPPRRRLPLQARRLPPTPLIHAAPSAGGPSPARPAIVGVQGRGADVVGSLPHVTRDTAPPPPAVGTSARPSSVRPPRLRREMGEDDILPPPSRG